MGLYNSVMLNIQSEGAHSKQNLTQEKYTKKMLNETLQQLCSFMLNHGIKLFSSVSEPSSASSEVSRSQKVSCKSYSMQPSLCLLINN